MTFVDSLYSRLGVPPASASLQPKLSNTNSASLTYTTSNPSTATAGSAAPALRQTYPTFDPEHKYVTSPVFRHPLVFALVRVLFAVYGVATVVVTLFVLAIRDGWAEQYYSFFTYLTFTGITAYYIAASVQTVSYYLAWRRRGAGAGYLLQRAGRRTQSVSTAFPLQRTVTRTQPGPDQSDSNLGNDSVDEGPQVVWWGRVVQAAHVVLASTAVTYPVIVTAVFWSLLAGDGVFSSPGESYNNISVHALNSLFALIEMVFSNSPPIPWITLPFGLLGMAGYLGVAYITRATQGFYTYAFLDPSQHTTSAFVAVYIVGICIAEIVVFCLVRGVMVLRERWATKKGLVMSLKGKRRDSKRGGADVEAGVTRGGVAGAGEGPSPRESEGSRVVTASEGSEGTAESWERV
ncbi:hypothetical protein BJ165DRAFT_1486947 [Panaeolus papilionaceus]|nr:hypothetical protein BJ165DRAFT_1486947 [Panaeolus papilionaceus]